MRRFRRIRAFGSDQSGSVTIEAVLWLPLFVMFLIMLADASTIFMNEARILRIVQDGTRRFATGSITDCAALESWLEARISPISPGVAASCAPDPTPGSLVYISGVSMPSGELDLSGATGLFANLNIVLQSQHFLEK